MMKRIMLVMTGVFCLVSSIIGFWMLDKWIPSIFHPALLLSFSQFFAQFSCLFALSIFTGGGMLLLWKGIRGL